MNNMMDNLANTKNISVSSEITLKCETALMSKNGTVPLRLPYDPEREVLRRDKVIFSNKKWPGWKYSI